MITFKKFLLEKEETINSQDPQELVDLIKHDCKKWLNETGKPAKDHLLYRGMNLKLENNPLMFKRTVRLDRRPKDTKKDIHEIFNKYFELKYGIKYRTQAMFASGSSTFTADYGHSYIVFPIGQYDYCWSPISDDLMNYFEYEVKKRAKQLHADRKISDYELDLLVYPDFPNYELTASPYNITKVDIDYEKFIFKILDDAEFTDTNLSRAIKSGHEIMIACDDYYVLNNINERNIETIYEVLDML